MKKAFSYIAVAALTIGLNSCHIYQKYQLPTDNAYVAQYADAAQQSDSSSLCYMGWERVFTDPQLQDYIRKALDNNKDLENARLNVDIARSQLKGAKLSYFPSVALNPNGGSASYDGSKLQWSYTIPLAVNWEIDAFAKILNRKRGAKVNVEMQEDYRQAVQSQIVCGVASTYYSLVLLNQQLQLSKRTSEIWKEQVESMVLMKEAGMVNEAAVVQSRANYFSIMGSIPEIENGIHKAQNALSLLMHEQPNQTWPVTQTLDFDLPDEVKNGVPMTYLAVRPDVRAAERGLAAAYYTVNSARAAFYPSINISAQGGFTNAIGSMIVNPGKWFYQLAGSLAAPLFSRGQNIANLEVAKAQQKIAMNTFENTVLSASSDVSNALVAIRTSQEKRDFVLKQIDELEKSVEYTRELLTLDRSATYLEVLTAQSSLLSAQLSDLSCWNSKVTALINLYQAVGGGR